MKTKSKAKVGANSAVRRRPASVVETASVATAPAATASVPTASGVASFIPAVVATSMPLPPSPLAPRSMVEQVWSAVEYLDPGEALIDEEGFIRLMDVLRGWKRAKAMRVFWQIYQSLPASKTDFLGPGRSLRIAITFERVVTATVATAKPDALEPVFLPPVPLAPGNILQLVAQLDLGGGSAHMDEESFVDRMGLLRGWNRARAVKVFWHILNDFANI